MEKPGYNLETSIGVEMRGDFSEKGQMSKPLEINMNNIWKFPPCHLSLPHGDHMVITMWQQCGNKVIPKKLVSGLWFRVSGLHNLRHQRQVVGGEAGGGGA